MLAPRDIFKVSMQKLDIFNLSTTGLEVLFDGRMSPIRYRSPAMANRWPAKTKKAFQVQRFWMSWMMRCLLAMDFWFPERKRAVSTWSNLPATTKRNGVSVSQEARMRMTHGFIIGEFRPAYAFLLALRWSDHQVPQTCFALSTCRSVWVDLTGDGRKSILTARAKPPRLLKGSARGTDSRRDRRSQKGQLVFLEMPKAHSFDKTTGTPLERDGTVFDPFSSRHIPWKVQ